MTDIDLEGFFSTLHRVVRERDGVPAGVVAAAKASFAWRSIDDELASLVYDSADEPGLLAGVRGGSARQLTFSSDGLTIELEVDGPGRGLVGQLVPPQPAAIEVRHLDGSSFVSADELGRFDLVQVPHGPVSLRCEAGAGGRIATDWVRL
jgi:hypothetical protein